MLNSLNVLDDILLTGLVPAWLGAAVLGVRRAPRPSSPGIQWLQSFVVGIVWIAFVGLAGFALGLRHPVYIALFGALAASTGYMAWRTEHGVLGRRFAAVTRGAILPLLLAVAANAAFLSHFSDAEIENGPEFGTYVHNLDAYPVIDYILQHSLSDNLFFARPLETNFNPDGHSVWSVGDRPMLLGLFDATARIYSGNQNVIFYLERMISLGAFFLFPLVLLVRQLKLSRFATAMILLALVVTPFYLTNTFFTWPKMPGLTFVFMGMVLYEEKLETSAGLALGLALLCHGTYLFAAPFLVFYRLISLESRREGLRMEGRRLVRALVPVLVAYITQRYIVTHYTRSSDLLMRVNLCKQGSFVYPTPPVSILDACREYLRQEGWSGILTDHLKSLYQGFVHGYITVYTAVAPAFAGVGRATVAAKLWDAFLMAPAVAFGLWTPVVAVVAPLAHAHRKHGVAIRLLASSIALLLGFWMLTAAYGEVHAHTMPYFAAVLAFVTSLALVWNWSFWMGLLLSGTWIVFSLWLDGIGPHIERPWLLVVAVASLCGAGVLMLREGSRSQENLS